MCKCYYLYAYNFIGLTWCLIYHFYMTIWDRIWVLDYLLFILVHVIIFYCFNLDVGCIIQLFFWYEYIQNLASYRLSCRIIELGFDYRCSRLSSPLHRRLEFRWSMSIRTNLCIIALAFKIWFDIIGRVKWWFYWNQFNLGHLVVLNFHN